MLFYMEKEKFERDFEKNYGDKKGTVATVPLICDKIILYRPNSKYKAYSCRYLRIPSCRLNDDSEEM